MSFARRITRQPIPYEPGRADDTVARYPQAVQSLIAGAVGCSPYLEGLATREAEWLALALEGAPEAAFDALLTDMAGLARDEVPRGLRQAKRRAAALIALADLGGVWSLAEVTGALTRLADRAVDVALKAALVIELNRGKIPGQTLDDLDAAAGMVVFAMGKMGAFELNYSSDIDLICLFDDSRYDPDDILEARSGLVRATRRMAATLSDLTGDGYVFRTDLRLRPDPSVTPVCLSMDAAERYYESVGRAWERAVWIKARAAVGDSAAGEGFLDSLSPFVWRKHLDFAAIRDTQDMRLRIREAKGFHGRPVLEGHNIKLGRGGIREIEFFAQTRQLIAGGRDVTLRARGTVEALARLADAGWVPGDVRDGLTEAYAAHREVEHRLQMIGDAQTHELPTTADGFDRLARFMGEGDTQAFRTALADRIEAVSAMAEDFFQPAELTRKASALEDDPAAAEITARWPTYPALRSSRATDIFARLKGTLFERLERASHPIEALTAFDGFLAGLPAGVQVFSLFEANPQLIDLMVDIAATAPRLARYLARNARVFDAVIAGSFFGPWPGVAALRADLEERLSRAGDYEARLDAARAWMKEWHFRIGVHHLRGLMTAADVGTAYADLADAVVSGLWPSVVAEFAQKHGAPPGAGATVLAMGSAGAAQLSAISDLDLIIIYDPQDVESSDGRRPLATRAYYARLTQALVTALSAPMAEGKLYEVDMRLRPSGRQGPVATSITGFRNYQETEAWTWEHLALTRARPVAGSDALGGAVEAFRRDLLARPRDAAKVVADVAEMRARIAEAKPEAAAWSAKVGPGAMQDIELLAAAAALLAGDPSRAAPDQLGAALALGWLSEAEVGALRATYDLLWRLQAASRLLTDDTLDPGGLGEGATAFLLRETGAESLAALEARLAEARAGAAAIIDAALASPPEGRA